MTDHSLTDAEASQLFGGLLSDDTGRMIREMQTAEAEAAERDRAANKSQESASLTFGELLGNSDIYGDVSEAAREQRGREQETRERIQQRKGGGRQVNADGAPEAIIASQRGPSYRIYCPLPGCNSMHDHVLRGLKPGGYQHVAPGCGLHRSADDRARGYIIAPAQQ